MDETKTDNEIIDYDEYNFEFLIKNNLHNENYLIKLYKKYPNIFIKNVNKITIDTTIKYIYTETPLLIYFINNSMNRLVRYILSDKNDEILNVNIFIKKDHVNSSITYKNIPLLISVLLSDHIDNDNIKLLLMNKNINFNYNYLFELQTINTKYNLYNLYDNEVKYIELNFIDYLIVSKNEELLNFILRSDLIQIHGDRIIKSIIEINNKLIYNNVDYDRQRYIYKLTLLTFRDNKLSDFMINELICTNLKNKIFLYDVIESYTNKYFTNYTTINRYINYNPDKEILSIAHGSILNEFTIIPDNIQLYFYTQQGKLLFVNPQKEINTNQYIDTLNNIKVKHNKLFNLCNQVSSRNLFNDYNELSLHFKQHVYNPKFLIRNINFQYYGERNTYIGFTGLYDVETMFNITATDDDLRFSELFNFSLNDIEYDYDNYIEHVNKSLKYHDNNIIEQQDLLDNIKTLADLMKYLSEKYHDKKIRIYMINCRGYRTNDNDDNINLKHLRRKSFSGHSKIDRDNLNLRKGNFGVKFEKVLNFCITNTDINNIDQEICDRVQNIYNKFRTTNILSPNEVELINQLFNDYF